MDAKLTRRRWGEWLLALALVALLSWASKTFTRAGSPVAALWLANGVLLGLVLTAPRERRPMLLLAGLLGNMFGSLAVREPWPAMLQIAFFNVFEVWVASARQRRVAEAADLTNAVTFRRFLVYAVVLGPLASTLGYALFVVLKGSGDALSLAVSTGWLVSHALGMATFTPVTLALRRDDFHRLAVPGRRLELLSILLLVGLVAAAVCYQSRFPMLFLIFPAMVLMAMRGGFGGTAVAVVVVVILALVFTLAGRGPFALPGIPRAESFLVLQVFIATLLFTMFPVHVVLASRARAHEQERASALRLRLLAEHSTDVIVLTDVAGRRLFVSPGVEAMFGYTPAEFASMRYVDYMHPEDAPRVRRELLERASRGDQATVTYRARRKDGREIWVEALVCTFHDAEFEGLARSQGGPIAGGLDGSEGRVVTLRDITRRRRAEEALAQANSELASLVWKDPLTGLGNRRRFDEALAEEWERCSRAGQPLSVVMLDVDWFKAFNDQHGHQQGDHRLVEVAGAIQAALLRPRDVGARYGGEEFAVILPATGVDEAGLVAERIRENVARLAPGVTGVEPVTVSLGVAGAVPLPRGRAQDLVKAADDALYTSKREGRNRTTLLQVAWPAPATAADEARSVVCRLAPTGT